jgi:uncharacterized protein YqjF (DUF2071 family)
MMNNRHRPWPRPRIPWVMAQTWVDLLFAHWPVPAATLRQHVPPSLQLETYDGEAWLGVVPFELVGLRLRGLPPMSPFPETNVRTYVTAGGKPGVLFFSLDAASRAAVFGARTFLRLPYRHADMSIRRAHGEIVYESRRRQRPHVSLRARYAPEGAASEAVPGSLDEWLTERYCLYTQIAGRCFRLEIDHPPWPLQRARAEIEDNTLAEPLGMLLKGAPVLHFAARQDMVAWAPYPVF